MYVMRIYKFLSTSVAGEKVLALVADIGMLVFFYIFIFVVFSSLFDYFDFYLFIF